MKCLLVEFAFCSNSSFCVLQHNSVLLAQNLCVVTQLLVCSAYFNYCQFEIVS
jgi:hypothetical protein